MKTTPFCRAPVPGGCGKLCAPTPKGFRSLCSGHVSRKKRGLPVDVPIGSIGVGRKRTVPRVGELFATCCPLCGHTRLLRCCPGRRRNCVCTSCQRKGKPTRAHYVPSVDTVARYLVGESAAALADECGVEPGTMLRGLRRLGVQTRGMSDAIRLTDSAQRLYVAAKQMRATGEMSRRMSAGKQGIPLDQWNGFRKDHWSRVRSTANWNQWRKAVFERDGYRCQECGSHGKGHGGLAPHHLKPKARFPELVFEVSNGITLCSDCHRKTFGKEDLYATRHQSTL